MVIKHVAVVSLKSRAWSPDKSFILVLHGLLPGFQESFVKREANVVWFLLLLDNRSSTRSLLTVLVYLTDKICSCSNVFAQKINICGRNSGFLGFKLEQIVCNE